MKTRGILVLLCLLAAFRWMGACGPFYPEALFQDPGILDVSRDDLAKGRYGVLRAGLPWQDLILVYRGLQGLPPPSKAPEGPPAPDAQAQWQAARAKVMGAGKGPELAREGETVEYVTVIHIGDDALVQAARNLEALRAAHGAQARDWVQAQDLVFASVPASPKIPAPVAHPLWLAQERDYQIAAARFYAGQWEQARQGFLRLAGPRRPWGRYLAARCWFREGQSAKDPEARTCFRNAQALLEAMLRDPACAPLRGAARDYLQTVRYRTEPTALLAELLEARGAGGHAEQAIRDALRRLGGLGWRSGPRRSAGLPRWPAPPGTSDLALWLGAMAGNVPWEVNGAAALDQWRQRGGEAWMVAALSRAESDGPELAPLKAAARRVAPGSPLAPTLRWHLLRLELGGLDRQAQARRLEQALREDLPPWAVNQLRQSRQALARDLSGWFAFAPRKITATRLGDFDPGIRPPDAGTPQEVLDPATARALSDQLPLASALALLREGRSSPRARAELAKAAWTKAVLLESWAQARALTPFLPQALRPAAAKALAGTGPRLRFQAALCLLDWPGLRPALEAGFGRQLVWNAEKTGSDPLAQSDALRDNWWCGGKATAALSQGVPPALTVPGLGETERRAAREEKARLDRVPTAQVWFGQSILPFARAHPRDDRVPYALHRFIRTTRIPQCPAPAMTGLGREAFNLLHRRYPQSPWTRKTPFYF